MSDEASAGPWILYLLECNNGSFYAGITNDLQLRLEAHLRGRGAKYTRANPPVRVVGTASYPDRSCASKAEWALKQQPRNLKESFLLAASSDDVQPQQYERQR